MPQELSFFIENSKRHLCSANRLSSLNFNLLKDNRLIPKILIEMEKSVINLILSLIKKEKNKIYSTKEKNLEFFFKKLSKKYMTEKEIYLIKKIILLTENHKLARLEFVKKDHLVMFSKGEYFKISANELKEMLDHLNTMARKINYPK